MCTCVYDGARGIVKPGLALMACVCACACVRACVHACVSVWQWLEGYAWQPS